MQRNRKVRTHNEAPNGNNSFFDYEAMVRGLINLCDDNELLICLDRNGVVKHIKQTASNGLFPKGKKLVGQFLWDLLPPETKEKKKAIFFQVLETEKAVRYESAYNGRWFDNMVYPIFGKQENVEQVLIMGRDITRSKRSEEEIRRLNESLERLVAQRTAELEVKANNLNDLNSALRMLLQKQEEEKKQREQIMFSGINQLIIPYLRRIQRKSTDLDVLSCIDTIDTHLKSLTIEFGISINSKAFCLTPTEIEVALLIKAGKSSKDIAQMLKTSHETVQFHRKNLRRKMGLRNKKENLRSYLIALGR